MVHLVEVQRQRLLSGISPFHGRTEPSPIAPSRLRIRKPRIDRLGERDGGGTRRHPAETRRGCAVPVPRALGRPQPVGGRRPEEELPLARHRRSMVAAQRRRNAARFGPCGTVLDRNVALLFSHPERDFPYFGEVTPLLDEGLLVPFYVKGEAIGTIWVVLHDETCRFDAEDLRMMANLGTFAAAAYQTQLSLNQAQRIASIVDTSADAIVSKNLDGTITTWNQGATRLFGYMAEEIIGRNVSILIPPDRQDEERAIIERIQRGERIEHYETICRRKDGILVPISLSVSPVKGSDGKIVGASKVARNISERKQKDEHIALLSREVDHRSKNLLSLVQATVRLAHGDTPDALKRAIEGRIRALANVHSLLGKAHWIGVDIRSLVTGELSPYFAEGKSRAELDGPALLLKSRSANRLVSRCTN